ncbi:MAG TPA: HAMP domain-containing sensor histidine kinase [Solirubrobacteraceae bacterium]|nr:HAMP domain-containing sensor histidine kinase [Solirubrobacteraceae bacterium]
MESPGSYIRSAARATYSEYRSVPIRWRLAGGSAALTFVILAGFAAVVGILTDRQVRTQFNDQQTQAAAHLGDELRTRMRFEANGLVSVKQISLSDYAGADSALIRIFDTRSGARLKTHQVPGVSKETKPPVPNNLFTSMPSFSARQRVAHGYLVTQRRVQLKPHNRTVTLLYAVPEDTVDQTLARVQIFLLLGVLGGTVLALLAGLFVSERAMSPIKELTAAAREIRRTRDPRLRLPHPEADDEIAELARTLEGMLAALDAAQSDTQAMLDRQREFVADASHELRTPLTSVLANLDLLAEELDGEQAETAEAALRSTRRMRRLVGDLLLLARADARRENPRGPTDVGEVVIEAAAELGPMAEDHQLSVSTEPAMVDGVRDELHRLVLNLMENALRHTPPGTYVHASVARTGDEVVIEVADNGPGIPPELAPRVFERFVRNGRDGGKGSGLGLAIVRSVAQSHGGTVQLERPEAGGTRFVIRLPALGAGSIAGQLVGADVDVDVLDTGELGTPQPSGVGRRMSGRRARAERAGNGRSPSDQTSTTTGRTIGRRRSRS